MVPFEPLGWVEVPEDHPWRARAVRWRRKDGVLLVAVGDVGFKAAWPWPTTVPDEAHTPKVWVTAVEAIAEVTRLCPENLPPRWRRYGEPGDPPFDRSVGPFASAQPTHVREDGWIATDAGTAALPASWRQDAAYFGDPWEAMAAVETSWPFGEGRRRRPRPAPQCGQVWRTLNGDEHMVVAVRGGQSSPPVPDDAELVAGPGSPWAP